MDLLGREVIESGLVISAKLLRMFAGHLPTMPMPRANISDTPIGNPTK